MPPRDEGTIPRSTADGPTIKNPTFWLAGSTEGAGPFSGQIWRGHLKTIFPDLDGNLYQLNFLYNPSVIEFQYNFDPNIRPREMMSDAQAGGQSRTESRSLGLALIFDRMMECASNRAHTGVAVDVEIFHRMIGITDINQDAGHPMPIKAIFGPDFAGWAAPPIEITGQIISANVSYTHFTRYMTPTRCVINIGLQQILSDEAFRGGVPSGDDRLNAGDPTSRSGGVDLGSPSQSDPSSRR